MDPTTGAAEHVNIAVTDFGPIEEAAVDLRPLTVFIGPSNAGKSYLATLVHALNQYFVARSYALYHYDEYRRKAMPMQPDSLENHWEHPLSEREWNLLRDWIQWNLTDMAKDAKYRPNFPTAIEHLVRSNLVRLYGDSTHLEFILKECFGLGRNEEFIRYYSRTGTANIVVTTRDWIGKDLVKLEVTLTRGEVTTMLSFSPELTLEPEPGSLEAFFSYCDYLSRGAAHGFDSSRGGRHLLNEAYSRLCTIVPSPFRLLEHQPYYLPADRAGIMRTHGLVVTSLTRLPTYGGTVHSTRKPGMSGVLSEFLTNLIEPYRPIASFASVARDLEADILKGQIHEERAEGTDYPTYYYQPKGWRVDRRLALMNTSSMISELAPVVLYLRHYIEENQALVIEEPESHLHPAAQADLAAFLVRLVKSGVHVRITTHSNWLIEQFSNLVRLSNLSQEQRSRVWNERPALRESALKQEKAGVWVFRTLQTDQAERGSTVKKFSICSSSLALPEQYEEVMFRLYDEWQEVDHLMGEEVK